MLQLSFVAMATQIKLLVVVVVVAVVALIALIIVQDSLSPFMCLRTFNELGNFGNCFSS